MDQISLVLSGLPAYQAIKMHLALPLPKWKPLKIVYVSYTVNMYASLLSVQFLMYVDKARNNFESTRAEVERLMKRIRSAEEDFKAPSCFTMEGYLYIQEKRELHKKNIFSPLSVSLSLLPLVFLLLKHIHSYTSAPA